LGLVRNWACWPNKARLGPDKIGLGLDKARLGPDKTGLGSQYKTRLMG